MQNRFFIVNVEVEGFDLRLKAITYQLYCAVIVFVVVVSACQRFLFLGIKTINDLEIFMEGNVSNSVLFFCSLISARVCAGQTLAIKRMYRVFSYKRSLKSIRIELYQLDELRT